MKGVNGLRPSCDFPARFHRPHQPMLILHADGLRPVLRRCVVALTLLGLTVSAPSHAQQFRAAWADVFHVGMGSQGEVDTMVSSLVTGHYNALIVQVLGYMD